MGLRIDRAPTTIVYSTDYDFKNTCKTPQSSAQALVAISNKIAKFSNRMNLKVATLLNGDLTTKAREKLKIEIQAYKVDLQNLEDRASIIVTDFNKFSG